MSDKKSSRLFTSESIAPSSSSEACYVTVDNKVYDVTDFLDGHPGGDDLIWDYAGKDVKDILVDESSHYHSPAAFEILEDFHVGYLERGSSGASEQDHSATAVDVKASDTSKPQLRRVYSATGLASAEDLVKDTDFVDDYRQHKFLDLSKPLLPQVWSGGFSKEFYLKQVHRPRHYRGGASAPLFGNFLEPLSKTPWWVIPTIWLPCVAYGVYRASEGLSNVQLAAYFTFGLFIWTLVEYALHRFLFHLDDHLPDSRVAITGHFLLHGIHHYLPMDKYRLVLPPTLLVILATPFYHLSHMIFYSNWYVATTVFCGGIAGYIGYDMTHYFLHHKQLPSYYQQLKKYHLEHHFADYENGFGVSSRFWDVVFGTELKSVPLRVVETTG